jgi:polyisoprenyl-phosphate glycosyltransferase
MMSPKGTVVILMATYNDWRSVLHLLPEIDRVIEPLNINAKIIIVDDGSVEFEGRDELAQLTLNTISQVDVVELARNYGNQRANAIGIGFVANHVKGDYVVVMDSDHEDLPEYIPSLLRACAESGDKKIIFAERTQRSESSTFRLFYWMYQWLYRLLTGQTISMGNFSVIPALHLRRLAHVGEIWNHFAAGTMRSRLPYAKIAARRGCRIFGRSQMNLISLVSHAASGFSVYLDFIAVRILLGTTWLAGAIVAVSLVIVGLSLFSRVPILGCSSLLLAVLGVVLLQIVTGLCVILFLVLAMRMQPPIIPFYEYHKYIFASYRAYERATAPQVSS